MNSKFLCLFQSEECIFNNGSLLRKIIFHKANIFVPVVYMHEEQIAIFGYIKNVFFFVSPTTDLDGVIPPNERQNLEDIFSSYDPNLARYTFYLNFKHKLMIC